jgi:hypothetical protein
LDFILELAKPLNPVALVKADVLRREPQPHATDVQVTSAGPAAGLELDDDDIPDPIF